MARALVIKNADFSANKLGTDTFVVEKPCTGLSLSSATLTFTTLAEQTLTATKTPADTTDTLYWASSDESVVTVADGVVTPHKSGTATITATCGSQTATCSVTCDIVLTLTAPFILGYQYVRHDNDTAVAIVVAENYGATINTTDGGYRRAYNTSGITSNYYPIKLPDGCSEVDVSIPDQNLVVTYQIVDTRQRSTNYDYCAKRLGGSDYPDSGTAGNRQISLTDYPDANGIYLTIYKKNAASLTQEMLDQVVVTAKL